MRFLNLKTSTISLAYSPSFRERLKENHFKERPILSNAWSLLEANWQNLKSFKRKLCGLMSLKFMKVKHYVWHTQNTDIQETPSLLSDIMLWSCSSAGGTRKLVHFKNNTSEGRKKFCVSNPMTGVAFIKHLFYVPRNHFCDIILLKGPNCGQVWTSWQRQAGFGQLW